MITIKVLDSSGDSPHVFGMDAEGLAAAGELFNRLTAGTKPHAAFRVQDGGSVRMRALDLAPGTILMVPTIVGG